MHACRLEDVPWASKFQDPSKLQLHAGVRGVSCVWFYGSYRLHTGLFVIPRLIEPYELSVSKQQHALVLSAVVIYESSSGTLRPVQHPIFRNSDCG